MLKIHRTAKMRNLNVLKVDTDNLFPNIKNKQVTFLGHIMRKDSRNMTSGKVYGHRKRRRFLTVFHHSQWNGVGTLTDECCWTSYEEAWSSMPADLMTSVLSCALPNVIQVHLSTHINSYCSGSISMMPPFLFYCCSCSCLQCFSSHIFLLITA